MISASLFSKTELQKQQLESAVFLDPACSTCGLYKQCKSPKMPVNGKGKSGVLIIAEAPGREEDERGTQLIGESGQLLRRLLRQNNFDLEEDCWRTNAIACRPPENRTPTTKETDYCRPHILRAIRDLQPRSIVTLGKTALSTVLAGISSLSAESLTRWVGFQIPIYHWNAWLFPTYHPAYLCRNPQDVALELWTTRHLTAAFLNEKLPPPLVCTPTICNHDVEIAAAAIHRFMERGLPVAVDYETNRLKPDSKDARIRSCAICSGGDETISYLWQGKAIEATGQLLKSPLPKIAANLKFEERWTQRVFGHGVRNWRWDTMQAAHVLDNRPGISGLKFQAFVQFGILPYDQEVAKYFKAATSLGENRIDEVPINELLEYGAMDAFLEYKLAERQMERMNLEFPSAMAKKGMAELPF